MTTLQDLFDTVDLEQALSAGYVRTQTHSTRPFTIYNYTELAAYEGVWNPVTRQCRGLIAHSSTGEIIARPFPKFMNHGQDGAHVGDAGDRVVVTDKQDGSLGILYTVGNGRHAVATRGSFASDQALHATAVWQERYADIATIQPGWTYLFEIIYPGNRIVVDYGPLDDLVLLAAVHIDSGHSLPPDDIAGWPGPRTETFAYASLAEAMAAPDRPGREGLVVHYVDANERIKIKQADYVELHRIVTGLNARVVWEHLGAGKPLTELIEPLPDEFHQWVRDVADELNNEVDSRVDAATATHVRILDRLAEGWTRRDYAEVAKLLPISGYLFALLDGRDIRPQVWRDVRPEGGWTPAGRTFTEDAA